MTDSVEILLIEDNDGDIFLTTEALRDHKIINNIKIIKDGQKAIEFFEGLNECKWPFIVLLDINLPKISGHQVLKYIKDGRYKSIPVIMLTTSSSEKDKSLCEINHVDSYMTKPLDVHLFLENLKMRRNFWFNIVNTSTVAINNFGAD